MSAVTTALVGFGFSGQTFHAPFLNALQNEFTVTTVFSSKTELVQQKFPHATVTNDFDQMLKQNIELVIITTPNTLHYEQTKKSILAGKHVVVEKPFMVTSQEASELTQLAKDKNVLLSVYHNRRFSDDFLTLKKLLKEGRMGELYSFEAHFDRYRPEVRDRWREQNLPGSGMLMDLGSHLIDQALQLFGKPDHVSADIIKQRKNSLVDDYFHVILHFGNKRAILHSSMLTPFSPPMISAHGTGASFFANGIDPQEAQLISGMSPLDAQFGKRNEMAKFAEPEKDLQEIEYETGDMTAYYRQVASAIRNGTKLPVEAEEAVLVMRVIEAAVKSAETKTVVAFM